MRVFGHLAGQTEADVAGQTYVEACFLQYVIGQ